MRKICIKLQFYSWITVFHQIVIVQISYTFQANTMYYTIQMKCEVVESYSLQFSAHSCLEQYNEKAMSNYCFGIFLLHKGCIVDAVT